MRLRGPLRSLTKLFNSIEHKVQLNCQLNVVPDPYCPQRTGNRARAPGARVPTSGRDARPESYINKTYRMEYEKRALRTVYIRTLSTPLLRQNRTVLPRRRTMYGK